MKRSTNTLCLAVSIAAVWLPLIQGQAQGTTHWTASFEGQPWGTSSGLRQHFEAGLWFRAIGPLPTQPPYYLTISGGGVSPYAPDNGTGYLVAALGESLAVSSSSPFPQPFALISVDLAEYSTFYPTPRAVLFIGYLADGSTVTQSFTTDGIIDGTGPLPDFQTFYFDSRFQNLIRVEVPTYGWSLDNLVFTPGLSAVAFSNTGFQVDAPVFDAAGVPLSGTNYYAMLYGGESTNQLHRALAADGHTLLTPVPFTYNPGGATGYFIYPLDAFVIAAPLQMIWLQVKAWDGRIGSSYEEALSRNIGGVGESALFQERGVSHWGGQSGEPTRLKGLRSFSLSPVTGVLVRAIRREGDAVVLEWYGGFPRYQVQQSGALGDWQDLGEPTAAFSATNTVAASMQFFRVVGLAQ